MNTFKTTTDELQNLVAVGKQARDALADAIAWLEQIPATNDQEQHCVVTWHLALATLAQDISESALDLARTGSLRAARMLNRCLSEYAFRAHYYVELPHQATQDTSKVQNIARKIMLPAKDFQGDMSDEKYTDFKAFLSAGDAECKFPQVQKMMHATLSSMKVNKNRDKFMERLEVEYTIGSGYIHGSQDRVPTRGPSLASSF